MNFSFPCPQCEARVRQEVPEGAKSLSCPLCAHVILLPEGAWDGTMLSHCLVCPSKDLFLRKNFPQRLGVLIVAIGIVASCVTWANHQIIATYAIFFSTALLDVILYFIVGNLLQCYRCEAQYRDLPGVNEHEAFHLETHERYRQQEARLGEPERVTKTTTRLPSDPSHVNP